MIAVQNLVKKYGSKVAVDDVSFQVDKGEVVGFLGPNGAGKSTTLRVIAGFLGLTSGSVKVAGHDITTESYEARMKLGYMPEAVPLHLEMRVSEYLRFRAELKRVSKKAIWPAMEKANVLDVANTVIGHLSKGYRQRVGLADALVASPPLLVLDEPTAGLDPNQIREVRSLIEELGKEHTVLLSTHILSEVEASCSRVVVIARGKLVAEGSLEELAKERRSSGIDLTVRDAEKATELLEKFESVKAIEQLEGILRCTWKDEAGAPEEVIRALVNADVGLREARAIKGSLEDLFAQLTQGDAPDEPTPSDATEKASP